MDQEYEKLPPYEQQAPEEQPGTNIGLIMVVVLVVFVLLAALGGVIYLMTTLTVTAAAAVVIPTVAPPKQLSCASAPAGYSLSGATCYAPCPTGSSQSALNPAICVPATCADGVSVPGPSGACYRSMQALSATAAGGSTCPAGYAQPPNPSGTGSLNICYATYTYPFDPNEPAVYNVGTPRTSVAAGWS
jgi:hypothetical protein